MKDEFFLGPILVLIPFFVIFVFMTAVIIFGVFFFRKNFANFKWQRKGKEKSKEEKNTLINKLLETINKEEMTFTFDAYQGISREECSEIHKIREDYNFSSEDLISGVIKNRQYKSSDVYCWHLEKDSDGLTSKTTDFRGRYFIFENDRTVNTSVIIVREPNFFSILRKLFPDYGEKVRMENDEFNKLFNVYCDDSIEALKTIRPHTMENLINFSHKFNDASMIIKLFDDQIHVLINNHMNNFCFYDLATDLDKLTNEVNLQIDCIEEFYKIFIQ